jgi:hypothetical protein
MGTTSTESARDTLSRKTPDVIRRILDELPAPVGTDFQITMPRTKQRPKQLAFDWKKIKRPSWEKPQYDLEEVARATRIEGFASNAINKHREHVLRHGWQYVSRNPRARAYIIRRMSELSESMGKPVEPEIRKAIKNFIKYSNFFLSWARDRNRLYTSRFRVQRGKMTGLFSMNPTCMRFRRTKKNTILEWYQVVEGHDDEQMKPVDVIHGAFDQDEGFVLGVPFILPALDDILTWRRFEEMAEIMAHKFAYPLYHHKIGTPERDPEEYDDGTNEIGEAASIVAGMEPEGHLFTSYRHEVIVVGAQQKALDLQPQINYWEARVLADLNMSTIDIGRGDTANRNTAETISKGLADRCAEYQKEFALLFNFFILDELLIEGGFDLSPENRVFMVFPAIDREARRAEETHWLLLYQGEAITHDELRILMGREAYSDEDWKKSHLKQVAIPLAEAGKTDPMGGGSTKAVTNKAKPTNQSGTKATKTKVKRDSLLGIVLEYDSVEDPELKRDVLTAARQISEDSMRLGIARYNQEYGAEVYLGESLIKGFVEDCVTPHVTESLRKSVNPQAAASNLTFYLQCFKTAAFNYGYARAAQVDTRRTLVRWKLTDSACSACRAREPMRIRRFVLGQMLPTHHGCVAGLEVADGYNQKDYLRDEARVIASGECLDSFLEMRIKNLPDEAFCGPDKTFAVDDEISALNALKVADVTRSLSLEKRQAVKVAIEKRMSSLGFTFKDAEARAVILAAGAWVDFDEEADMLDEVRAVSTGMVEKRLSVAERLNLNEKDFAGPNRTFPAHDAQTTRASWYRLQHLPLGTLPAAVHEGVRTRLHEQAARLGIDLGEKD